MDEPVQHHDRPVIEWVFGLASGVAVLCLVAFLGYQALFAVNGPAELAVAIERIERLDNGTLVTVAIVNRGDEAATGVTVNATLAPRDIPDKQITLDYVAAHAVRRGMFHFPQPVQAGSIDIQIGGYTEP
ncbi:hypothetical protein [Niveispirillum sp. KHB5.9]|uniref:hypothetical protein n=1 Tax=Niveispirillum sp. KHB5.9 TaxID=3400269 RepID=UPI003A89B9BD